MTATPIYKEKLKVNYPFIIGILLWAVAVGLAPGIILGGLWWLFVLYLVLTVGIVASFFQMEVELLEAKLIIKYGPFYRKVIEAETIQCCSPCRILRPVRTYGGWGIRKGRDGTFALTQAFVNEGIKLETPEKTFVISSHVPEIFSSAVNSVLSERG